MSKDKTSSKGEKSTRNLADVVDSATSKVKSSKGEKSRNRADAANKGEVVRAITDKKDLKYHYPEDVTTLGGRKKFRASTRGKISTMLDNIEKVKKKKKEGNLRQMIKDYNAFENVVHVTPNLLEVPAKVEKETTQA